MNAVAKPRSSYWDNIKGALILLTVFAHMLYGYRHDAYINALYVSIYTFHMPVFVFVSGYFGKRPSARSARSILRLALLYLILNSAMVFVYGEGSFLEPVYSCWFLLALIAWRLTAHRLAHFRFIVPSLFFIAILVGFYNSVDNTMAIARIICFYPFYMMGYLLPEEKVQKIMNTPPRRFLLAGVLLVLAAGVALSSSVVFRYSNTELLMNGYTEPRYALGRVLLFVVALLMTGFFLFASVEKKLPLITMLGKNSLSIYFFHRPVTLFIKDHFTSPHTTVVLAVAVIGTLAICLVFGNDLVAGWLDAVSGSLADLFMGTGKKDRDLPALLAKLLVAALALGFIAPAVSDVIHYTAPEGDVLYPVMSAEQQEQFDDAFRITFSGDLILLEDQVKRAYDGDGYDFSPVFEYAEKYISSADYAIGVFEGPMPGEEAGYSTSNYDDGKELALGYPDSFAAAVKDAGFDLVTTANNHLLDKGVSGAMRTLDVLDEIGLDHTGSYRDQAEKDREHIKLVEVDGIRMAILSYTYGSNGHSVSEFVDGELAYITSAAANTKGADFDRMKAAVEQDFADAKALDPDLIVVLPHIGTQFINEADKEQKTWFDIFKSCGADIILGDHSHAVQPAYVEEYDGKTVFTAYCPGNFANIYREYHGDTSMLVDVYIDRSSKTVIGGSVVPLYTQSAIDGNYRALPIHEIVNDPTLRSTLSTDDYDRAAAANALVTKVLFGHEMDISAVPERYYFDASGYLRPKTTGGLILSERMKDGVLYGELERASSVCFIGDSVTEGTKNGGCPWYEPIEEYLGDKQVLNYSKGSTTVSYMLDRVDEIPEAELYVIATGTNDVRYRDSSICAMTAEEYVQRIDALRSALSQRHKDARFVFIAPWYSTDGDTACDMSFADKTALNEEYTAALEEYCAGNDVAFINANPFIRQALHENPDRTYLLDHIHPNAGIGVVMYSEAVLSY